MVQLIESNTSMKMSLASEISKNCADELTAIEGYQDLLSLIGDSDPEAVDVINEIVSDEKNHVERLTKLMKKYDDISASKD